ncbi:MAG: hypothetical protein ACTSRP_27500 [Candidatus Helarchaeota archaeon]
MSKKVEKNNMFSEAITEKILPNLNVVVIDGIDQKIAAKLKRVFKKKAQYLLELEFNEDIIDLLESKNYTIQQAIEEEPESLKSIVQQDMYYVKKFLENLVQITIFLDANTCRTNSIGILHKSKLEPELTREQILAKIYNNDLERSILDLLREMPRSKRELQELFTDQLVQKKMDIHDILDHFIRAEIVQQDWVENEIEPYFFLIGDFFLTRKPALKIINEAKKDLPTPSVAQEYLASTKEVFSSYEPNSADNSVIAENLLDPKCYWILKILREKPYQLKKLPKRSKDEKDTDIKNKIKSLEKDGIVKIIKDENNKEWVLLLTDITAEVFFPEFMIELIRQNQMNKKLNDNVAIKHLDLLEHTYDTFYKIF